MTLFDLKSIISGWVKIYTPLEISPYWEEKFYGNIVEDYFRISSNLLEAKIHHIEAEFDDGGDPVIAICLEN